MTGPTRLVTSCTETNPFDSSGVTSAVTVTPSLILNAVLCVVVQVELLSVIVVVGDC